MLQTPKMIVVMIVKWIIPWKNTLAYLVKDAKSVAGFSLSRQFRVGRSDVTYERPGGQVQFQNGGLQSCFFRDEFHQASRRRQKVSFLEGRSPLSDLEFFIFIRTTRTY